MRRIGLFLSDTHAGSVLALTHPETVLDEKVTLNEGQQYLWELYEWALAECKRFAGKDEIFIVHDGDVTQGTKRPKELISTRMADHIIIAKDVFSHAIKTLGKNVKSVFLAKGTGSHVFEEGSAEILLENLLQSSFPRHRVKSMYHGILEIGENTLDFAHHGPGAGTRSWLHGNELRYYLRDRMMSSLMNGQIPASLYIRGHFHTYRRELLDVAGRTAQIVLLPSMTLMDDYARQVARSPEQITNGLVMAEFTDKGVEVIPLTRTLDFRTKETV